MDGQANGADTMPCTNCGHEIRRGMLRCRECGQSTVETAEEFVLTRHQLLPSQDPKCPLCGAFLDPGTTDCAACTSALLDQLLNGPEDSAAVPESTMTAPRSSGAATKLHVRRASPQVGRARSAPDGGPASTKPGAAPARARQTDPARTKAKGAAAVPPRSKTEPQFAGPEDIQAANQQAVNQHAANQHAASKAEDTANAEEVEAGASTTVETSAACTALLASLPTADAMLRCGIATALGKLGDKQALVPLERHLTDQDIRVRRAVATALMKLGHPKGQTLLEIAERKPAAAVLLEQRSSTAPKPRKRSGGGGIDGDTLKKLIGVIVAVAIAGGGIWYWMNSAPSTGSKKSKSTAAKKAAKKAAAKKPVKDE